MTGADALDKEAAAYFAGRMAFIGTVAADEADFFGTSNTAKSRTRCT